MFKDGVPFIGGRHLFCYTQNNKVKLQLVGVLYGINKLLPLMRNKLL